jgi:hypothetical protein
MGPPVSRSFTVTYISGRRRVGLDAWDKEHGIYDDASERFSLVLSREIANDLDRIADETNSTRANVLLNAIALVKLANEEKKKGRALGFASDPDKLGTVVVGRFRGAFPWPEMSISVAC